MSTKVRLNGKILTIELRLQAPTVSTSGKSLVVATTRGQINTGIEYEGEEIVLVANAFINKPNGPAKESVRPKDRRP
jgi:hypothetical protein